MTAGARVGFATTVLAFLGGVWIFLAPFVFGYQEVGEDWITATTNDLWTGGALMAVSALTLFVFSALALRDAEERRRTEKSSRDKDR